MVMVKLSLALLTSPYVVCGSCSDADAEFDRVIGIIEDIIMEEEFQQLQHYFMEKYYMEFDDSEENRLSYTTIFNEYVELLEKHIERQLTERIPGFHMNTFTNSLMQHKDEISGDVFDMLLTFTDFLAFKEMFVEYRAEREGRDVDLSAVLVVKSLNSCASPSAPFTTFTSGLQ
ncbi:ADP-ribosylation factor-like 2 binding protein-like [Scleropages formosus]|uniref:ADP-ribosylation factor-like protein 2-binding protein n=1 Tax=Scleropages formosus TaxID=113540 RepID=A0A0P7VPA2_SCLFO|nr:ADP-ribosylation factor-like 2 binding protein-like [Scleropages formosus]